MGFLGLWNKTDVETSSPGLSSQLVLNNCGSPFSPLKAVLLSWSKRHSFTAYFVVVIVCPVVILWMKPVQSCKACKAVPLGWQLPLCFKMAPFILFFYDLNVYLLTIICLNYSINLNYFIYLIVDAFVVGEWALGAKCRSLATWAKNWTRYWSKVVKK